MANKTVGLDARLWDHPGIGRYIRELSRELLTEKSSLQFSFLGDPGLIRAFFADLHNRHSEPQRGEELNDGARFIEARSPIYSLAEQFEICRKASCCDLLHVPHFNIPVFYKKKLVVTIHDLIYFHERKASRSNFGKAYVSWLIKVIANKAQAVITVSEYTKNDLLNHFPALSRDRIFVTHEAPSSLFKKIEDRALLQAAKERYGLLKPFVIFVGTIKPHKNLPTLVKALQTVRDKYGLDHELVIVGRKDERQKKLLGLLEKTDFVRLLGTLDDQTLVAFYNAAEALVMPSFYEGFGLPAVEAMACGTPVIVSNRTSLPEVVGDAGALFDPDRVGALEELLYNILSNGELRNNMSSMGLEQARLFSWKKMADQTRNVYEQVMR